MRSPFTSCVARVARGASRRIHSIDRFAPPSASPIVSSPISPATYVTLSTPFTPLQPFFSANPLPFSVKRAGEFLPPAAAAAASAYPSRISSIRAMEVVSAPHADPLSSSPAFANRACDASVLSSAAGKAAAVALDKAFFHSSTAKKALAPASAPKTAPATAAGSSGGGEGSGGVKSAEKRHRARVYTRTGDKGTSSLYTGERRRKDDHVFGALGDVDELNSALAVAAEYCRVQGLKELCEQIATIQSRLLDVGSVVATPPSSASAAKLQRVRFDPTAVDTLELWIDSLDEKLPPLTAFILPSGGMAAAHLHLARSICRRAERAVIAVAAEDEEMQQQQQQQKAQEGATDGTDAASSDSEVAVPRIDPFVMRFINRLSDFLFTAARFAAQHACRTETVYKKAAVQA
ncbi:hypothetical protein CLOP_g1530 [Closterium sp. NIES-67]|nr:hypothetical protein CLOP_g1530 [Closterium sp. NIES-67]